MRILPLTLATVLAASVAATPAAFALSEPVPTVTTPASQVGDQLRWLLDAVNRAPIPESELAAHFAADFLAAVPAAQINQSMGAFKGMRLDKIASETPTEIGALVTLKDKQYRLDIGVDSTGKINYLLFTRPAPTSWQELDERLRKSAPRVGFLAAEVLPGGRCRPVHAINADKARPLGSMFKLYVLGAVAKAVKAGRFDWDTPLTIKPSLKSLPSGVLQDRPDNSTVPVSEAADLMISISDNTGADLLLHQAGRRNVEAVNRAWSSHANAPFLSTREMFLLKGTGRDQAYLSRGTAQRRAYLAGEVAKVPLSEFKMWNGPRDIDTIEWFGSPLDVCRAHAHLRGLGSAQVNRAMSLNDGTMNVPGWSQAWYKGGSEPGVLDVSYSARSASGRTFVVTAMASDPGASLLEADVANELMALSRGAFGLLS